MPNPEESIPSPTSSDLTLEAMRLTRNHPSLNARTWFEHMLYADELGSEVREVNQFKDIIVMALAKRNFSFESDFNAASMKVLFEKGELTNDSPASREKPLVEWEKSEIKCTSKGAHSK